MRHAPTLVRVHNDCMRLTGVASGIFAIDEQPQFDGNWAEIVKRDPC